jgi:hypothetical protein
MGPDGHNPKANGDYEIRKPEQIEDDRHSLPGGFIQLARDPWRHHAHDAGI